MNKKELFKKKIQNPKAIAKWLELPNKEPQYALVAEVDLVVMKLDNEISVLYGRCLHRGVLLSDGHIDGDNLICGVHGWDYRSDTGVSEYNSKEALKKFVAWIEEDTVYVDEDEIKAWALENPQSYKRKEYLGLFEDVHGSEEEPYNNYIRSLAKHGLSQYGSHGPTDAMGVPRQELPSWNDIQLLTAQLHKFPLLDEEEVASEVIIGPNAKKPLQLNIPLFVSDMSYGSLSEEAKVALAKGAELAGTGICSGEGGMLSEEQKVNSRYFYELASARFGFSVDKVKKCQAFHFKGGQGAKTGTGGHLPGSKVKAKIAETRGLAEGQDAISPSRFPDWNSLDDIKQFAEYIRKETGGIPVGYKLSAQHIEKDIDAAIYVGVDYIILDGRGGGTGAAPLIFRDNISVPTIPALARAKNHLQKINREDISLIITGGLRTPDDFIKALALGADAIAISNSALQAIGCLGMRACNTNNCPVGIATQKDNLRKRLEIEKSAKMLNNFFKASVDLMKVMARACGHKHLKDFSKSDLTSFKREICDLSGISFAGIK